MSFTVLRNLFLLSMRLALPSKWTCGAHDTKKSSHLLFHFIFSYYSFAFVYTILLHTGRKCLYIQASSQLSRLFYK